MKRLVVLFSLLWGVWSLAQETINFETIPFKDILEKAKQEKKLVFVDAYAVWCGPCKMMERNVFPEPSVREFYNANFINTKIDMEKGEGRAIAQKYSVYSYPTYLYINDKGEVVYSGRGQVSAKDFVEMGKNALMLYKEGDEIKNRFEKGEKNLDFLMDAMKKYASLDYNFAKKVSERYFEVKKNNYTKEEISMLIYFLKSAKDANYKVFESSKEEIIKHIPANLYRKFKQDLVLMEVLDKAVNRQAMTFDENYFRTEAEKLLPKEEAYEALNRTKLMFYSSTRNFEEYEKTALEYYKDGENFEGSELMPVAHFFSTYATDPQSINTAIKWVKKGTTEQEDLANFYILAKLYKKLGDKQSAKSFAEKALKLAKEQKMNVQMLEKFVEEIDAQ